MQRYWLVDPLAKAIDWLCAANCCSLILWCHKYHTIWNLLLLFNAPISGMPYLQYQGLRGVKEGNWSWDVLMEQAPIPGTQTCIPSPSISLTNTSYLPVVHSEWHAGRYGYLRNSHRNFPNTFSTQQRDSRNLRNLKTCKKISAIP